MTISCFRTLTLTLKILPKRTEWHLKTEDAESYPVSEKEAHVPEEWIESWWWTKLDKLAVGPPPAETLSSSEESDDEEDLYGT